MSELLHNRYCFAPHVRKHVDVVLHKRFIGMSREKVTIKDPQTSCSSFSKMNNCDRFTMIVPYAGTLIEFFVMFQASQPECPPDFIFSDFTFFAPVDEMDTLRNWDFRKSDGLYRVLKELMNCFKRRHLDELIKYPDLNYEYLSMFEIRNFSEDDIEVFVPSRGKNYITMLVRLHVEFCDILPDVSSRSGKGSALVAIQFSDIDNKRMSQKLYLSEEIISALGINNEDFEFPGHSKDFQLNRFVLACEDKLRCQVDSVASKYEKRKAYFARFISRYGTCIVEYDIIYFLSLVLLLEIANFYFLVEINLPENYPIGIPDLIFRSIYHKNDSTPTSIVVDSYPYNSTWPLDKVFNETMKFIEEYATMLTEEDEPLFCGKGLNIETIRRHLQLEIFSK